MNPSDFIYSMKSVAHTAVSSGNFFCTSLGEFTTPDMPSLDFLNLSLNDSIALFFSS